jgi:hypothetical protein
MIWWTHWPKQELYKAGRYAEAVPKAQRVLEIREKMLGPDHPNIATLPGAVGSSPSVESGSERVGTRQLIGQRDCERLVAKRRIARARRCAPARRYSWCHGRAPAACR